LRNDAVGTAEPDGSIAASYRKEVVQRFQYNQLAPSAPPEEREDLYSTHLSEYLVSNPAGAAKINGVLN